MGMLDGGITAIFGSVFGGVYLDGTLHRDTSGPIYDGEGNVTGFAGGTGIAIKVQTDRVTYAMRQADGYSEGDVALMILAAQLGDVEISTDHQVTDGYGKRWSIESADLDAAASHWVCRGRKA